MPPLSSHDVEEVAEIVRANGHEWTVGQWQQFLDSIQEIVHERLPQFSKYTGRKSHKALRQGTLNEDDDSSSTDQERSKKRRRTQRSGLPSTHSPKSWRRESDQLDTESWLLSLEGHEYRSLFSRESVERIKEKVQASMEETQNASGEASDPKLNSRIEYWLSTLSSDGVLRLLAFYKNAEHEGCRGPRTDEQSRPETPLMAGSSHHIASVAVQSYRSSRPQQDVANRTHFRAKPQDYVAVVAWYRDHLRFVEAAKDTNSEIGRLFADPGFAVSLRRDVRTQVQNYYLMALHDEYSVEALRDLDAEMLARKHRSPSRSYSEYEEDPVNLLLRRRKSFNEDVGIGKLLFLVEDGFGSAGIWLLIRKHGFHEFRRYWTVPLLGAVVYAIVEVVPDIKKLCKLIEHRFLTPLQNGKYVKLSSGCNECLHKNGIDMRKFLTALGINEMPRVTDLLPENDISDGHNHGAMEPLPEPLHSDKDETVRAISKPSDNFDDGYEHERIESLLNIVSDIDKPESTASAPMNEEAAATTSGSKRYPKYPEDPTKCVSSRFAKESHQAVPFTDQC